MATVTDLRNGIATNIQTIPGVRTAATMPDNVNPPIAIIYPESISYDDTFQRGMQTYQFAVVMVVGRVSERSAQNSLDAIVASTGEYSMKLAIESDKTLGGKSYDVRVTNMRAYSSFAVGDVNYLAAEFVVLCYAD